MLALHSMTDAKYSQWGPSIPSTDRVVNESDYEEFSGMHLMPSLTILVCLLALLIFQSSSAFLYSSNTQIKHVCYEGPNAGAIINPPLLPWSVYAYGLDGFARKRPIRRNTNVMGYSFPEGTHEHEKLILLTRNLMLDLIEYFHQLYGGGDDEEEDDHDDGSDGAGSSESTSSHQQRKRHFQ
ncbi:hypothetical protein SO802_007225 [Lithocarpus litseifolius]|uniref:Uncharacterized protein n=1 Tax=Lithocarpus litseifolius TaxID=425828 RepID=A0AAW2DNE7_9ROSI